MESTVFYAWQSDLPNNVNRGFIRDALESALEQIAADVSIDDSPRLDQDTKDTPGMPAITETIFRKIGECSVFVADLSFVGCSVGAELLPNPNVLIELGYAVRAVGWDRIVGVFNTAFGSPEGLPFDLKNRRWPIDYRLEGNAGENRSAIRMSLSKELEKAIRLILQQPRPAETHSMIEAVLSKRAEFHELIKKGKFADLEARRGALAVLIVPERPARDRSALLERARRQGNGLQPMRCSSWDEDIGGGYHREVAKDRFTRRIACVTELIEGGVIRAATSRMFEKDPAADSGREDLPAVMHPETVGRVPLDGTLRYLQALRSFGVTGPAWVDVSLITLPDCQVNWPFNGSSRVRNGDITPNPVRVDVSDDAMSRDAVAAGLRPVFDYLWRELHQTRCPFYDRSGKWTDI